MPKMLMGQIDHARKRVKQIKAEKVGAKPTLPDTMSQDELHEQIKSGELNIPLKTVQEAFAAFRDGRKFKLPQERNIYSYQENRRIYTTVLDDKVPDSIDAAIRYILIEEQIAKDVSEYKIALEKWTALERAVELEATSVEDAIVLGDQSAALKALKKFADFDPRV